jgi:putative nucleotidyltransferase with HDIG domain
VSPDPDKSSRRETTERPQPAASTKADTVLAELIHDSKLPTAERKKLAAARASDTVVNAAMAKTFPEQAAANAAAKATVQNVLAQAPDSASKKMIEELWTLPEIDPEFEHAVTVSTYAVLFSLAFGQMDPAVLNDIALAALLHDIGMSRIPRNLTRVPATQLSASDRTAYEKHVVEGLAMLQRLDPQIPPRVLELIHQHHEKFDGNGFPRKLEGFQYDDIAQLISVADFIETMSAGLWDGTRRTFSESVAELGRIEKSKTFPEFFNPEILANIMRWIKSADSKRSLKSAERTAEKELEETIAS